MPSGQHTHEDLNTAIGANTLQIEQLATQVEELSAQAHVHDQPPTEPPVEPPSGEWWDVQKTEALATLMNDWGPQDGATLHTSKQVIEGNRGNFIVQGVNERGVQAKGLAVITHAGIYDCGSTTLPGHSPRNPAYHVGKQNTGADTTLEDSQVFGGKIQGAAGGNNNTVTLRRVHFRDNADGAKQNDGAAVAGCVKVFDFGSLVAEDLICEQDSAVGLWMDGSGWRDATVTRGLWRQLGGPAVFFELGKNGTSTAATIINCAEGFLIDADNITITGAAIFGCPWPVRVRPGSRNGRARGVQASVTESYVEFTSSTRYGMARTWANNGARSLTSNHNTFRLDPAWKVFRWADINGGPVRSLNFEEWQAAGFDQDTTLV